MAQKRRFRRKRQLKTPQSKNQQRRRRRAEAQTTGQRYKSLNAELHEKNVIAAKEKEALKQQSALKYKQATETADYAQRVAGLALVQGTPCKSKTTLDLTSVNRSLIAVNNELMKRVKELEEKNACLRENNTLLTEQNRTVLFEVQDYIRAIELNGLVRGGEDTKET
ncbi:predicted protein [Histoplasma capsulatum H143]|uniref:Uncharacterized protein n=1 Tax=Ajellomyces capsulatus (strain H143) TaxID=544712 RepID=C6HNX1_AJECH|nr:predicted protein [Histoplasma capsulatum H143]